MILHTLSLASIAIAIICLVIIAADVIRNPQKMWIMNIVWPVTGLYSGPLGLLVYYKIGKNSPKKISVGSHQKKPFWQSVLIGAFHCGSGCTLGDIIAAGTLLAVPFAVFGSKLYGEWVIDYIVAFVIGIIFQYYAIKPMKNLSSKDTIIAALKADTLSLTSWQIGMYGWMAICDFLIFHHILKASAPVFWFMMQIAMLFGLLTAFPVNWWLIKKGIKEAM